MLLPRPHPFRLRDRSLLRSLFLSLGALVLALRLCGFPDTRHLHSSNWQFLPVLPALWGMFETLRCLRGKWSLYHAGILLLLYSELMILALAVFLCVYPI